MLLEEIRTASDCPRWILKARRKGDYKGIGYGVAKELSSRLMRLAFPDQAEESDRLHAELADLAERLRLPTWPETWDWFAGRSEFFERLVPDDEHGMFRCEFVEGVMDYHDNFDITYR